VSRTALAARQREVLDDLLAGRVPEGFDPAGAAMTTLVLHRRRSSAALAAAPELRELDRWRERFHAWCAAHPQEGCAHDDVRRFAASPAVDADWRRLHEVYDGRRSLAWVRVGAGRELLVRFGTRVWRLSRKQRERSRR
jgi:hypothetical protein